MRIRKDFEDYIVCGKSPETIYAQMIEITAEGEEIERDDLTATLSITSGGGLRVEDPTFTGGYMGAFVSADENELAEEGIVRVAYSGKGGSFTNNIHFRIIGEPRIKFPEQGAAMDLRLNVLYGDNLTYDVEVELVDFIEPPNGDRDQATRRGAVHELAREDRRYALHCKDRQHECAPGEGSPGDEVRCEGHRHHRG